MIEDKKTKKSKYIEQEAEEVDESDEDDDDDEVKKSKEAREAEELKKQMEKRDRNKRELIPDDPDQIKDYVAGVKERTKHVEVEEDDMTPIMPGVNDPYLWFTSVKMGKEKEAT